jgi:hypothetical protein
MILNVGIVPWYLTISGYKLIDNIWALVAEQCRSGASSS